MRVLSLVPSATETLLALGVQPIGCTRFCLQPGIPTVGGTKNPDIALVLATRPDLVVMNDEENRHEDYLELTRAGVPVHSMSPRSLADVGPTVDALARAVGVETPAPFAPATWAAWLREQQGRAFGETRRCVTLVWRRPWMGLGDDTYGASVLAALGYENLGGSDARYPELEVDDLRMLSPDVVLLPSEPYPFTARHRPEFGQLLPGVEVRLIDGQDLFWWGARTPAAVGRLRAALT